MDARRLRHLFRSARLVSTRAGLRALLDDAARAAVAGRHDRACLVRLSDSVLDGYDLVAHAGHGRWPRVVPRGTTPLDECAEAARVIQRAAVAIPAKGR